jgi:hypothetical protein
MSYTPSGSNRDRQVGIMQSSNSYESLYLPDDRPTLLKHVVNTSIYISKCKSVTIDEVWIEDWIY